MDGNKRVFLQQLPLIAFISARNGARGWCDQDKGFGDTLADRWLDATLSVGWHQARRSHPGKPNPELELKEKNE